jgi:hypothetical protein
VSAPKEKKGETPRTPSRSAHPAGHPRANSAQQRRFAPNKRPIGKAEQLGVLGVSIVLLSGRWK